MLISLGQLWHDRSATAVLLRLAGSAVSAVQSLHSNTRSVGGRSGRQRSFLQPDTRSDCSCAGRGGSSSMCWLLMLRRVSVLQSHITEISGAQQQVCCFVTLQGCSPCSHQCIMERVALREQLGVLRRQPIAHSTCKSWRTVCLLTFCMMVSLVDGALDADGAGCCIVNTTRLLAETRPCSSCVGRLKVTSRNKDLMDTMFLCSQEMADGDALSVKWMFP